MSLSFEIEASQAHLCYWELQSGMALNARSLSTFLTINWTEASQLRETGHLQVCVAPKPAVALKPKPCSAARTDLIGKGLLFHKEIVQHALFLEQAC